MKNKRNIKGFSVAEVLIAISLFALVSVISSSILINISNVEKKSSIENAIYEDMRIILQQLTKEIQSGAIDYEEYYNYYVVQNAEFENNAYYGVNYGIYGSRFYDPGRSLDGKDTINPDDLGVECSFPAPLVPGQSCEISYALSVDFNTGQHPFKSPGSKYLKSNAFCDEASGLGQENCNGETDHLFLINDSGTRKTIISRKKTAKSDYAIGILKLDGDDLDGNGYIDTFYCNENFNCSNSLLSEANPALAKYLAIKDPNKFEKNWGVGEKYDLENIFDHAVTSFVPISPLRSNIVGLRFIINPLEVPYKAYGEPEMQTHPSVTIILTLDLAAAQKANYPGDFDPVTVQTTVAAGVLGKIDSYPSVSEEKTPENTSWITGALPPILETP